MRTLKIPFPDCSFFEKTRLQGQTSDQLTVPVGASSLYFRNPVGFIVNDWVILEAFESEDAEIIQVGAVDREAHLIDLLSGTQTYQEHAVGVIVMKTPYNKVKVYKGTSTDMTTHVEMVAEGSPFDLRPDNAYTYIPDPAGTSLNYYSYKYWNTTGTGTGGTQTLYTTSDYDSIMTVWQLKNWFMFGLDLTDDDGYPFPNSMFEFAIRAAVDSLQKTLQLMLVPTTILCEYQDFYAQDYRDFAFLQLNQWPVISVEKVQIKYPTAQAPIDFPIDWVQLRKERGQIHLVPTSGSLSTILMGRGGDYLTFVWRGYDFMPNLWRIDYTAGFPAGQCPNDIVGIVGKMACFYPLNIAGDLVGGIAIASKSIGIDGLSQSINTTSSPENAGYCVVGETDVQTVRGKKSIKSLVGSKPWLYSHFDGKWIITKAEEVWLTRKNAVVWKVKVGSEELITTKNHPVKMFSGLFKYASNLKPGDIVITSKGFEEVSEVVPSFSKADVYDISVPLTRNFIGNQVVIHNSARLRQYERELKIEVPRLVQYYKAMRVVAL